MLLAQLGRRACGAVISGAMLIAAGGAVAQEVAVETAVLGTSQVTLHVHPFLSETELATLRLVATNEQALAVFVPGKPGTFAAMAASPDEGVIREGQPVASAIAVGDVATAEDARAQAIAGCEVARKTTAPCVAVLEIAPVP